MSVIHNLEQGSDAWHQFRLQHGGASEAAAMLGLSKKVKRSELLHAKHTGLPREFSDWVQKNILDYGHEVEAMARPIIEEMVGTLYPVTMSEGLLSASCDGLTLEGQIAFEHKQWNEELAASVAAGIVPEEHLPQCQQILLVTGAEKVIFVVSDGTREKMVMAEVFPDKEWFARICAGWERFFADLRDYIPREAEPEAIAASMETLPAVSVRMDGSLAVRSNLPAFGAALRTFVSQIPAKPSTDNDFATCESACKALKKAEEALDAAEVNALASINDVEEMRRLVAEFKKLARDARLASEKLVDRRKMEIRAEIVAEARRQVTAHITAINEELKPLTLQPRIATDFASAIKNKRTVASVRDACDTAVAQAKIQADGDARIARANIAEFKAVESLGFGIAFPDLQSLIGKATDDFKAIVAQRVAAHKAAEDARVAAELKRKEDEAEKARLAAEAKAKADAELAERIRTARDAMPPQPAAQTRPALPEVQIQQIVPPASIQPPDFPALGDDMDDGYLAEFISLIRHIELAFVGQFEGEPRPGMDWWVELRERMDSIKQEINHQEAA